MKESDKLKKSIFHAPEGYFDQLPGRVQERIQQEDQANKTLSLPRWTYAVAASVLVLLVAGIFFYQQYRLPADTMASEQKIEQLLASVPDEELIDYLQTHAEVNTLELVLTEEEQQEILLQGLESYEIPYEDYEYELYELEEQL
jgi:hypothetical protein